ncbi:C-type mannose receptor 2-like isoform X2 [Epargyreus clarus]|uniref:C-type mannose receptor 2-like isoform X2 n=1 Tax=Epargyreus clarus TaxID=520877 RepID=UPI003C306A4D
MINIPYARETLYLVFIIMFAKSERPKFRDDYRYEKAFGAYYKLHTAANWVQARIRCEAEGAQLIVPNSLDEADSMPVLISPILSKFQGVYVGIHDFYSERTFVTIQGNPIQNSILDLLWELKQPMHSGGRCVAMRRNGHLFVNPCSEALPFVCKVNAKGVKYYEQCDTFDPRWKLGPNDTCYMTHEERQTWHDAYSTCLSAGGYLAIMNSREEIEHIREEFKNVDKHKTPGDFAFLGYSDLLQRYHYRTVLDDRVDEREVDWDIQCGQNISNKQDLRCGGIGRSGLLAIGDCRRPSMFFCEKPAKGSITFKSILRLRSEKKEIRYKHKIKSNTPVDIASSTYPRKY